LPSPLALTAAAAGLIIEGTTAATAVPKQLAAMTEAMTCLTARAVMWLLMML
jgi:hypothetical protein